MTEKTHSIANALSNPSFIAAGVAGVLSVIVKHLPFYAEFTDIINTLIAPISILISYFITWLLAHFQALTLPEVHALSRLNKREKIIIKQLDSQHLSPTARKSLQKELDEIAISKARIGKTEIKIE